MLTRLLAFAPLLVLLVTASPTESARDHELRSIRGWRVHVDPALLAAEDALSERVLELLDHRLFDVERALPQRALRRLKEVEIWMDLEDGDVPGGVYHPSREWLVEHERDSRLARCVQFGNAENFLAWSHDQPWMVLHELAHAYHHQVIGYDDEGVLDAYRAAEASGDYGEVLRCNGSREVAYAMSNVQEYFAELSEAYFGVNDFYPFVRAELREHDPRGFAALEEAWGE